MNTAIESIHVLHVDDESDIAELTAEFLERDDERFTVDTATSASDGLDRLTDTDYDCIVSDYDMPRQDGIDFLEAVRERHSDLPFILYTGKGTGVIASEAIAAGVTDYLQKGSGTDQYTVLANRITNAIEQYRSTQRAAQLERLRRVVKDANEALLRAETSSEIKQQICEVISDADPYLFAWFGEHDPDVQTVEPRATAGIGEGYLDAIEIRTDEQVTAQGPTGQAVRTHEIVVQQDIEASSEYVPWREPALDRGYQSSAAIPITRDNSVLGVLNVYADQPHAFDDEEQELLADLAADTGQALTRIECAERLRLFGAAVEAAGHSIVVTDTEGTIKYVNPAFEEVTGYTAEEAVGRTPHILKSGEHDEAFYEELWDTILAGDVWRNELINTTKSGDRYVTDQTIAPMRAEDDAIKHFVAVNSDITERKEREQQLERYETLVEATADPMYMLDDEGHFTYVNEAFVETTGYSEATLLGEHISKAMEEDHVERGDQLIESLLSSGERQGMFEMDAVKASGERIPTENHLSLLYSDGEFHGTVGVLRDITDRLEQERQLKRERDRLDEFAGVVSHDLRNPLNVAEGRVDLAMGDCASEHLGPVARAHERMESIIDDVLSLARAGESVGEPGSVELADLVETCWQTVETASAELVVETETTVQADATRIQQLFENLVRNAVEHGGEDITITVGDLPDGFYVEDDGVGIPEDERENVFNAGYSTVDDGTGFGLNIVQEIAKAHEWDIHVTEGVTGGARFEVTDVESVS
jgi:PAS domain S-box-containing protein